MLPRRSAGPILALLLLPAGLAPARSAVVPVDPASGGPPLSVSVAAQASAQVWNGLQEPLGLQGGLAAEQTLSAPSEGRLALPDSQVAGMLAQYSPETVLLLGHYLRGLESLNQAVPAPATVGPTAFEKAGTRSPSPGEGPTSTEASNPDVPANPRTEMLRATLEVLQGLKPDQLRSDQDYERASGLILRLMDNGGGNYLDLAAPAPADGRDLNHADFYQRPTFEERSLSAEGGIFLRPRFRPELVAGVPPDHPILRSLDRVWDLENFKTGRAPIDFGPVPDPEALAMPRGLRVLDLPIKMAGSEDDYRLPRELAPFASLIQEIIDREHALLPPGAASKYYAYLTIDQGFVEQGKYQRRPGKHVDGFQGASIEPKKEVNHSWIASNLIPTFFYTHFFDFSHLKDGVHDFFLEMDRLADKRFGLATLPDRLYLMDAYSVHEARKAARGGHRTFLRLSFEREVFDRKGNTHNPLFDYAWEMREKKTADAFVRYEPPRAKAFPGATYQEVHDWLRRPDVEGEDVIARLARDPALARLFDSPAGVREGYTLREHTSRVYAALKQALVGSRLKGLRASEPIDFTALLKFVVALHDIGKPLAVRAGDKKRQHEFTLPILETQMKRHGFRETEIRIARALVDNDILGDLVRRRIAPERAYAEMRRLAAQVGMQPGDFFELERVFYTADATSYPRVRRNAFAKSHGVLGPKNPALAALGERLRAEQAHQALIERVDVAIRSALEEGRTPAIVFDLDDTTFYEGSHAANLLARFDRLHGTRYFAGMHYSEIDHSATRDFADRRLSERIEDDAEFEARSREVQAFLDSEWHAVASLEGEVPNPFIAGLIRRWKTAGARILYATGRMRGKEGITRSNLEGTGLPIDGLLLRPGPGERPDAFKDRALGELEAADPDLRVVAFVDNDGRNLRRAGRRRPGMIPLLVRLSRNPSRRTIETTLEDLGRLSRSARRP